MLNDYHVGSVPTSILILFTSSVVLRAILLILESIEKRGILLPPHKTASPEVISGPLNRGVFFWLSTLFFKGHTHILKLEDLYPLDPKMHSQDLYETLKAAWDKIPDKTAPNALFSTWLEAFSGPLMSPVIPKLFQIGFTYAQPSLITAAIDLAARPNGQPYNNDGYGLIGAYFHNILVETVSKAPMSFHTTVDSGVTVHRFSQDLQLIDMELPAATLGTTLALSFGLAQFVIICVSSRYMAVVLPFILGAFYIIHRFYLRTSR